jgi:type IV pilus assembly protein PilC
MDSGVPMLQALTIVGETSGNAVIARGVRVVHDAVKEGENIAPTLASTNIFPPMVISMVEVGEETGELPDMLRRIADNFDDEVDNAVAGLTSTIEPLMIVMLAVIVGVIVIALFLPLIGIIEGLQ